MQAAVLGGGDSVRDGLWNIVYSGKYILNVYFYNYEKETYHFSNRYCCYRRIACLLPVRAFLGEYRQYRSIYRRHGSWLDGQSLVRETHRLTG